MVSKVVPNFVLNGKVPLESCERHTTMQQLAACVSCKQACVFGKREKILLYDMAFSHTTEFRNLGYFTLKTKGGLREGTRISN